MIEMHVRCEQMVACGATPDEIVRALGVPLWEAEAAFERIDAAHHDRDQRRRDRDMPRRARVDQDRGIACRGPIDEARVIRAVRGESVPLNWAERTEAVRRLARQRLNDVQIGTLLHMTATAVNNQRLRNGIPGPDGTVRPKPARRGRAA